MAPARHSHDHRYDSWGQDTRKPREEEFFAAEMGQPSDVKRYEHRPAVLAQTPVRCGKCERLAEEFVDTIVLVDGVWMHAECAEQL